VEPVSDMSCVSLQRGVVIEMTDIRLEWSAALLLPFTQLSLLESLTHMTVCLNLVLPTC